MAKFEALVDTLVVAVIEWTESLNAKGNRPHNRAPAARDDLLTAIRAIEVERDAAVARERAIIQALGGEQGIDEGRDSIEFARSIVARNNDRIEMLCVADERDAWREWAIALDESFYAIEPRAGSMWSARCVEAHARLVAMGLVK